MRAATQAVMLERLGKGNDSDKVKIFQEKIRTWLKTPAGQESSEDLWQFIESGQLDMLRGLGAQTDKPLTSSCIKWASIPQKIKIVAVKDKFCLNSSTLKLLKRKDPEVVGKLFAALCACRGDRPIARGIMESDLEHDIDIRATVVMDARQFQVVHSDDGEVDWSRLSPYSVEESQATGLTTIMHKFTGEKQVMSAEDSAREWVENNMWDEHSAYLKAAGGHKKELFEMFTAQDFNEADAKERKKQQPLQQERGHTKQVRHPRNSGKDSGAGEEAVAEPAKGGVGQGDGESEDDSDQNVDGAKPPSRPAMKRKTRGSPSGDKRRCIDDLDAIIK